MSKRKKTAKPRRNKKPIMPGVRPLGGGAGPGDADRAYARDAARLLERRQQREEFRELLTRGANARIRELVLRAEKRAADAERSLDGAAAPDETQQSPSIETDQCVVDGDRGPKDAAEQVTGAEHVEASASDCAPVADGGSADATDVPEAAAVPQAIDSDTSEELLDQTALRILEHLAKQRALTEQVTLAARLELDRATVSKRVKQLCALGYAVRGPGGRGVAITDAGRKRLEQCT